MFLELIVHYRRCKICDYSIHTKAAIAANMARIDKSSLNIKNADIKENMTIENTMAINNILIPLLFILSDLSIHNL